VTLAEELPVKETIELYQKARKELKITPDWLVVNALFPGDLDDAPPLDGLFAARDNPKIGPVLAAAAILRSRYRINRRHLRELAARIPLPRIELPYLFVEDLERSALDQLAETIEGALYSVLDREHLDSQG
jgi:hypothetical protein